MSRHRIQQRRAPDGITPLVGYRVWMLSIEPIPDPDDLAGATIVPRGSVHGHLAEILRKLALTPDPSRAPS